jgi:uncharacterized protein (UPF0303 family)
MSDKGRGSLRRILGAYKQRCAAQRRAVIVIDVTLTTTSHQPCLAPTKNTSIRQKNYLRNARQTDATNFLWTLQYRLGLACDDVEYSTSLATIVVMISLPVSLAAAK